jgi:hypothetical protein
MNRTAQRIAIGLLLLLPGSIVRAQQFAWTASNYTGALLYNYSSTPVVFLDSLPSGNYVIQAKASMSNIDGSPQNAGCRLNVKTALHPDSPITLDSIPVRLDSRDGGDREAVALQGMFCDNGQGPYTVEVDCSTYQGGAQEAVLTATAVPLLEGCPQQQAASAQAWVGQLGSTLLPSKPQFPIETPIGKIDLLPGGKYIISAKTSFMNQDDGAQDGSCQLVARDATHFYSPIVLDTTDVRAAAISDCGLTGCTNPAYQQVLALQGTFCSNGMLGPFTFEIDCTSYAASLEQTVITAIEVSSLTCPPLPHN